MEGIAGLNEVLSTQINELADALAVTQRVAKEQGEVQAAQMAALLRKIK